MHEFMRRFHFFRHHHHQHSPERITDLGFFFNLGVSMATVTLTGTVPVTRKSGAALALTDIKQIVISRNGSQLGTLVPTAATFSFTDTSPLTGNDTYNAETITNDGFTSDPSNDAVAVIATADPAVAITDLAETVNP
jgi:hypothetical protein